MANPKTILIIALILLISSCSVERKLRSIDLKKGPAPIMNYLVTNHSELFDYRPIEIRDTIRDTIPVVVPDYNFALQVADSIVKNNDFIFDNDSLRLVILNLNGQISIKGTVKTKIVKTPYQNPVIVKGRCPPCPDLKRISEITKPCNKDHVKWYHTAALWFSALCIFTIIIYLGFKIR